MSEEELVNSAIVKDEQKQIQEDVEQVIDLAQEPESQKQVNAIPKPNEAFFESDILESTTMVEEFSLDENFDYDNTPFVPKFSKEDMELMRAYNSKPDEEVESNYVLKPHEHLSDHLPPL